MTILMIPFNSASIMPLPFTRHSNYSFEGIDTTKTADLQLRVYEYSGVSNESCELGNIRFLIEKDAGDDHDPTAVKTVTAVPASRVVRRYNLAGQQSFKDYEGIQILLLDNGEVIKVKK